MWLGVPSIFAMLALSYFIGVPEFVQTIKGIMEPSPIIRISVGLPIIIFIIPLCIFALILLILKGIPIEWGGVRLLVRLLNISIFAAAAFVVIGVPTLKFLQFHYMPQFGYSKCYDLSGRPTMWFNDWVKNPEWCVRGKDRAWVLEQAQRPSAQR